MFVAITAALLVQSGTSVAADEATPLQSSSASPNESASAAMAAALANANVPLEYSQVTFHGPGGLTQYRCDQFVRDYDWWYRTWPVDQQDRVFKTLRGFAVVADMRTGKTADFDAEWKSAIESCRTSPSKMMLDQLKPHGALFRGMVRK